MIFLKTLKSKSLKNMRLSVSLMLILMSFMSSAQVIIGPTTGQNGDTPKALLDLRASNPAAPVASDGFLLPRLEYFPDADQVLPHGIQEGTLMIYMPGPDVTPEEGRVIGGVYVYTELEAWELLSLSGDGIDDDGDAPCGGIIHEAGFENGNDTWAFYNQSQRSNVMASQGSWSARIGGDWEYGGFIDKQVDFSNYSSVTISFKYRTSGYDEGSDSFDLWFYVNGWYWVERFYPSENEWTTVNVTHNESNLNDITRIDFSGNANEQDEYVFIDEIVITATCN